MRSRNNPLLFVTDVLNAEPEAWQREALSNVSDNQRLAIRSGHGVGKTTLLAWIILWWLTTRLPCKVLVTANSQDQLRDVTWAEIQFWARRLPKMMFDQYDWNTERISLKAQPESCFAAARTASKERPESLQGFHSDNSLVVVEEASGIHEDLFPVMLGALSTPASKMVMAGNPTRLSGYFFDAFHILRDRFWTTRVNSEDVPRARGHIDDVIAKYGKESNAYRIRVQGEFPTSEDEQVIPLEWVEAATARDVASSQWFKAIWGLDVARFGDDRTALAKRQGNVLLEPVKWWRQKDTMQVAGLVKAEYETLPPLERPSDILVDVIGIGAGVVDRLRELGLPCRGINVGESASSSERFMRLRDELWFKARDWFAAKDCRIPKDDALIAELTAPLYTFTSNGKVLVERKDELKDRGLLSPDLADAFCLTFAGGLEKKDEHEIDAYRRRARRRQGGWMTA